MLVFGKLFQPSLMFVGKAGACLSEETFKYSNLRYARGLTRKHSTMLEGLARDKHSSLVINYGRKKFYYIESRCWIFFVSQTLSFDFEKKWQLFCSFTAS
jgi:hypothetical protein